MTLAWMISRSTNDLGLFVLFSSRLTHDRKQVLFFRLRIPFGQLGAEGGQLNPRPYLAIVCSQFASHRRGPAGFAGLSLRFRPGSQGGDGDSN